MPGANLSRRSVITQGLTHRSLLAGGQLSPEPLTDVGQTREAIRLRHSIRAPTTRNPCAHSPRWHPDPVPRTPTSKGLRPATTPRKCVWEVHCPSGPTNSPAARREHGPAPVSVNLCRAPPRPVPSNPRRPWLPWLRLTTPPRARAHVTDTGRLRHSLESLLWLRREVVVLTASRLGWTSQPSRTSLDLLYQSRASRGGERRTH